MVAVLLLALFQSSSLLAQDLLRSTDLSTLKVDYIFDCDIAKIKTQLQSNDLTIEQAEPIALSKGMPASEFVKLRARIAALSSENKEVSNTVSEGQKEGRKQEKITNLKVKDGSSSLVIGSQLFDNPTLNFEPNLKLATPVNYILGPGDDCKLVYMECRNIMLAFPYQ
jgi:hypothetical protein